MSRRKNPQYPQLKGMLTRYAASRTLDFEAYSPWHMRIMDGGYTTLDVWTTSRYYVLHTDYAEQGGNGIVERGGEKGSVPLDEKKLFKWLDKLFYAADPEMA